MANGTTQPGFDVDGARKAGYSDDEILQHLMQNRNFDVQGALKQGYTKGDVINFLASRPATPTPTPPTGPQQTLMVPSATGGPVFPCECPLVRLINSPSSMRKGKRRD